MVSSLRANRDNLDFVSSLRGEPRGPARIRIRVGKGAPAHRASLFEPARKKAKERGATCVAISTLLVAVAEIVTVVTLPHDDGAGIGSSFQPMRRNLKKKASVPERQFRKNKIGNEFFVLFSFMV